MLLLEHQAKELFVAAGIPVPEGRVVHTSEQAAAVAGDLAGPVMLKAQVRAGGRGKPGGVLSAADPSAAGETARKLLSLNIAGLPVRRLLVERQLRIERELYLGLTIDYDLGQAVALLGGQGGVEIEARAGEAGALARAPIDPVVGLPEYAIRNLVRQAGLTRDLVGPPAANFSGALRPVSQV